jgi:DNA-directed RNA polymerase specialized sigma24 family protein
MSAGTRKWSLSPQAFELFLRRLDPDRERASREYEALRSRLVDFFDWRGSASPDTMADETIDRVARKLEQGEVVDHVGAYAHAVARRVLQERYKRTSRERKALDVLERDVAAAPPPEEPDARLPCLKDCLERLPGESQTLIVAYYDGDGRAHLSERKALADQLGLTYATLKTRAHRVRNMLEECLKECVGGPGGVKPIGVSGHLE